MNKLDIYLSTAKRYEEIRGGGYERNLQPISVKDGKLKA